MSDRAEASDLDLTATGSSPGTDGSSLASLMSLGDTPLWTDADLAAMLRHQMRVTLEFDLSRMHVDETTQADLANLSGDRAKQTFGQLFSQENPALPLLRLTKDFAKSSRADKDSPLPPEIATTLYYAAIIAARLRWDERISGLSDAELMKGIDWALSRPWMEMPLRGLFEEGKKKV